MDSEETGRVMTIRVRKTAAVIAATAIGTAVFAASAAVDTVPGMPPVPDAANLYSEVGAGKLSETVRGDLDPALVKKLTDAFLKLDPNNPDDKEIMALQRASKFIPSKKENYDGIEKAAQSAGLLTPSASPGAGSRAAQSTVLIPAALAGKSGGSGALAET